MKSFFQLCLLATLAVCGLCATVHNPEVFEEKRDATVQPPQEHHEKARSILETRGKQKKDVVTDAIIYKDDKSSYVATVEEMCLYSHNHLRQQHKDTPDLVYDQKLAAESEAYAKSLVKNGDLVHSSGANSGEFGENLYTRSTSYDVASTPSHGGLSWYSESWEPFPGKSKNYNYAFDPTEAEEVKNAGTGHFSAMIWKGVEKVGCGVATTKYTQNGVQMTRSMVVARYSPTPNLLGSFPANVMPLKSGASSLKGKVRVGDLLPALKQSEAAECKDRVQPDTCGMYNDNGFCYVVEDDCNCECAPTH